MFNCRFYKYFLLQHRKKMLIMMIVNNLPKAAQFG